MEGLGIQGLGFRVGSKVTTTAAFLFLGGQLQGFYEGFMVFSFRVYDCCGLGVWGSLRPCFSGLAAAFGR